MDNRAYGTCYWKEMTNQKGSPTAATLHAPTRSSHGSSCYVSSTTSVIKPVRRAVEMKRTHGEKKKKLEGPLKLLNIFQQFQSNTSEHIPIASIHP